MSRRRSAAVSAGDIRAAELAPILPALFLIDVDPFSEPRFRFCGAAIAVRYGRDLTEESFLALWNIDDRVTLRRDLGVFAADSTGLVAGVMAETSGGGFTAYEMLLLPLASENGTAGAIGSMARIGGHGEKRNGRTRILAQWLRSVRFLPDAHAATGPDVGTETDSPQNRPGLGHRRYGHLMVVNGGK